MGVDWITEDPVRVGSVFRVYETIVLWARDGARGHPRARRLRRVHRCADQWWCQADDPAPRVVTRLHFHFATSTSSSLLSSPLLVLKITGRVVIIERTYSVMFCIESRQVPFVSTGIYLLNLVLLYVYICFLSVVWSSSYCERQDSQEDGRTGLYWPALSVCVGACSCALTEAPVLIKRGIFVSFYN